MNKYQEALEKIRLLDCYDEENFEIKFENIPIIQELVDRATPKKPIVDEEHIYDDGVCPNCHSSRIGNWEFNGVFYKHCADCGQALDWTNESEQIAKGETK